MKTFKRQVANTLNLAMVVVLACHGRLSAQAPSEQVQQVVTASWQQGEWRETNRELHLYENHKLAATTYHVMKSGEWSNQRKMAFSYSADSGLEAERVFSNWKENRWAPNLRFTAERDDKGRLINEPVDIYKEGSWELSRKNSTQYNRQTGKKTEQVYYNLNNGEWVASWKDEYEFKGDLLVKKSGFRWNNETWTPALITYYRYDEQQHRTAEQINQIKNDIEVNWRKTEYTLEKGRKSTALIRVWKDNGWVNSQKQTFHYQPL